MTEKLVCPKCGSPNVETDDYYDLITCGVPNEDDDYAADGLSEEAVGHCRECNTSLQWSRIYRFVGYDHITIDE